MWHSILLIVCSCTCGAKTDCIKNTKISVVMNFHGKACQELSDNSYQEIGNHLIQNYNDTDDGFNAGKFSHQN